MTAFTPAPAAPGWVYILTNPAMPGIVKIGLTTRTPTVRAAELSAPSGVLLPYQVAWSRAVPDCATVERLVHRMLDDRRVSGQREGFRCDVKTARRVIEAVAGDRLGRRYRMRARQSSRRRRGKDCSGAVLLAASVSAAILLVELKPPLPGWLPMSVLNSLTWLETLNG